MHAAFVGEAAFVCARLRELALVDGKLCIFFAHAVRIFARNDDAEPIIARIDRQPGVVPQSGVAAFRDALLRGGIADGNVCARVVVSDGGRRDRNDIPLFRTCPLDDFLRYLVAVRPACRNFDYDCILQLADREADDRVSSAFAARVDDVVRPAVIVVGQTYGYRICADHIHHFGGDPALFALYVRQTIRRHVFHDRRVVAFDHVLRDLGLIVGGQAAVLPCQGQRVLFDDDRAVESKVGVVFRALDACDHIVGARGRIVVEENLRLKDFVIVNVQTLFARARFVILVGHAFGAELRHGSGGRLERFELRVRRGVVALVRPAFVRVFRLPAVLRAADLYRKRTGEIVVVGRAHLIMHGVGVCRCDIAVGVVYFGQIADRICKIPSGEAERPADLLIVDRRSRVRSEKETVVGGVRAVCRLVLFEEVVIESVVDDAFAAHNRDIRKVRRVNDKIERIFGQRIVGVFAARSRQGYDDLVVARFRRRGRGFLVLHARLRRTRIGVYEHQRAQVVPVNIRQIPDKSRISLARIDRGQRSLIFENYIPFLQRNGAGRNFQRAFVVCIAHPAPPIFAGDAVDRVVLQHSFNGLNQADARDVAVARLTSLRDQFIALVAAYGNFDSVDVIEPSVALAFHVIPTEHGDRIAVVQSIGVVGRFDPHFAAGDGIFLP